MLDSHPAHHGATISGGNCQQAEPASYGMDAARRRPARAMVMARNVRELQNVIERAIVLAHGKRVEVEDLPEEIRRLESRAPHEQRTPAAIEREHILRVLDSVGGNRTKAAAILGIGPATLFRRLKTLPSP
jgi:two-component system response regulator HydG